MKSSTMREFRTFIILTLYLTLFLSALTMYRRFILADDTLGAFRYGYNLFEAMILAKIILLGQMLKLGSNKYLDQPLIVPTLYKSAVFCIFVVVFKIIEHFVLEWIKGKEMSLIYQQFADRGLYDILGLIPLCFSMFILFFSLWEINRWLGEDKLYALFFKSNKSTDNI